MEYQNLEHTADLKIRSHGQTLEQVFTNMAQGMYANIIAEKDILKNQAVNRKLKVKAGDLQSLLVDFLNELVSLSDINNEIYTKYNLHIKDNELIGEIKGYKIKRLKLEIKAVTYNELKIEQKENQWIAEVVFDI